MQRGFIVDEIGNSINLSPTGVVSYWLEGKPEWGWFGLKVKGKEKHDILAYRCDRCGLMKFYAGPDLFPETKS